MSLTPEQVSREAVLCIEKSNIRIVTYTSNGNMQIINKKQLEQGKVTMITGRTKVVDTDGETIYPLQTEYKDEAPTETITVTRKQNTILIRSEAVLRLVRNETVNVIQRKDGYVLHVIHVPNLLAEHECVMCTNKSKTLKCESERVSYFWRDRKSTRLNSSHSQQSRMPSSA